MGNFIQSLAEYLTRFILGKRGVKFDKDGIQQPPNTSPSDGRNVIERRKTPVEEKRTDVGTKGRIFNLAPDRLRIKNLVASGKMNNKAAEFLLCPVLKDKGYSLWGPFCQAWLETGRFIKVIGLHNYWGIKVPKKWEGKIVEVQTKEFQNGQMVDTIDKFIDFETIEQAQLFYDDLIKRLYPESHMARQDVLGFFHGLTSGESKWATDPSYKEKLTRVYQMMVLDPRFREFII